MAFDEKDALALKTIFGNKRYSFFVNSLRLLIEFVFITQIKKSKLIQNFSKVKNEIMSNVLRCLDIILIQQSVKILHNKGIKVKSSEYLVKNSANLSEEKHFLYDPNKGMIFHGEFLSEKFKLKVQEIWDKLNNFKIKIQRLIGEIKYSDENVHKKIFILDKRHQIIYSNKLAYYGFGHFQKQVQKLEENSTKSNGESTLETFKLGIEDLFSNNQLKHAIYELIIKLVQIQVSTISFSDLGIKIEILLDVQRNYQDLYIISFDKHMLINCSKLFDHLLRRISEKLSGKDQWQTMSIENKKFPWRIWDNNNHQFVEPSEKSSIYSNDSGRSNKSGFKGKGDWMETLSGFNKSANPRKSRPKKKTSISSNLMNLSIISKNPDAQKSIVMEYVPNFLNNSKTLNEDRKDKSEIGDKSSDLVILKSTRNLKKLDCGKSMFFKEPFNPNLRYIQKYPKKTSNDNVKEEKQYFSNIIGKQNRFNTFSKKIKRTGTDIKDSLNNIPNDISENDEFMIRKSNDSFSEDTNFKESSNINKSSNNLGVRDQESLGDIKNRKRHSTFGRISLVDQEKLQKIERFNENYGSSESEKSIRISEKDEIKEEKKIIIKDSDKNIFDIESDTKLSENTFSSKLIHSGSGGINHSIEEKMETQKIIKNENEEGTEKDMEVIKENVSEYRDNKSEKAQEKINEEEEGKIFFERQLQNKRDIEDMHSFEIISKSIELKEPSEHSIKILKDIERDTISKQKFNLKNLFSLKRFMGMFGGLNKQKTVTRYFNNNE
jgi:hypothetical protein